MLFRRPASLALLASVVAVSVVGARDISDDSSARTPTNLSNAGSIGSGPIETPAPEFETFAEQSGAPWGLDVLDGIIDGKFDYRDGADGTGIDIYIVDSGVYSSHPEFGGRALQGRSYVTSTRCRYDDYIYTDLDGHGTHVAGITGSTTYGVAKNVRIIDVRILDNCGRGDSEVAAQALRWIMRHHKSTRVGIVNMSFGGESDPSTLSLESATVALLSDNLIPIAAAGNESANACMLSPAKVEEAITVGAVGHNGSSLFFAGFSNKGPCVDILAPGVGIRSTWNYYNPEKWTLVIAGTSMAAPFVSGVGAMFAQTFPNACATAVRDAVLAAAATPTVTGLPSETTNKVLNMDLTTVPNRSAPGRVTQVIPAASSAGTVTVAWDRPCSGRAPVTASEVDIYRDGVYLRRDTLTGNATSIEITGLVTGGRYSFRVRSNNSVGDGKWSTRSREVVVAPLRRGIARSRSLTDVIGVSNPWAIKVTEASSSVCTTVYDGSWRIVGLSTGTCTLRVRPPDAGYTVLRRINVT